MARYLYKIISTSEFSPAQTYKFRMGEGDESLTASIRRRGIVQPLLVTPSREIISGYRRFSAARTLCLSEIPVLELEKTPQAQEALLLSVLSNWHQPFSDIEKAGIVFQAKEKFGFEENEILEEVFPALKMNPDHGIYEDALQVMGLQPPLVELIASGHLPYRGARSLSSFTTEDQRSFAMLAAEASFTTNQLLKIVEWFRDLLRKEKISLKELIERQAWSPVLKSDQPRNAKGDQVFYKVRALRFPNVAEKEKQFLGLSTQLKDAKTGLSAEMPPFFEGEGFILKARLNSPDALEAVVSALQGKRKVLNSLLDIVL